jgi:hypothetical protein
MPLSDRDLRPASNLIGPSTYGQSHLLAGMSHRLIQEPNEGARDAMTQIAQHDLMK